MADLPSLIASFRPDGAAQVAKLIQNDFNQARAAQEQLDYDRNRKIMSIQDQLAAGTEDLMKKYSIYNPQGAGQIYLNEKAQIEKMSRIARNINQAPLERRGAMWEQIYKNAGRLGLDMSDVPALYGEDAQNLLDIYSNLDMSSYQQAQIEESKLNREDAMERLLLQDKLQRERDREKAIRDMELETYKQSLKNNQQEEFNKLKDADKEALVAAENLPLAEQKLNELIKLIDRGYNSENAVEGWLMTTAGNLGATGGTLKKRRENQILAENQAKNVILPLLRQTLGAQFTENEGKRILSLLVPNADEPIKVRQDKVRQYIGELRDKVKSNIKGRRLEKFVKNDYVKNLIEGSENNNSNENVVSYTEYFK